MTASDLLVDRTDGHRLRVAAADTADEGRLAPGQVLLRVDSFGLSTNNVTYAALGDALGYWRFFPAPEGWGRVPVWGFADVARSRHPDLAKGERVFGFLPMSTHLVVAPERVRPASFADASAHRADLPAVYNHYVRAAADPGYDASLEAEQLLLRPLFLTSFVLDDFVASADAFHARWVVLSSASSKTAMGLAHLLSRRDGRRFAVVGLTSAGNAPFVAGLGSYDRVVTYDDLAALPTGPAALVDFAGDDAIVAAVHRHYRDDLRHSAIVGATHGSSPGAPQDLPGPQPELFFAPTVIRSRTEEWGPQGFDERYAVAWRSFVASLSGWLRVQHDQGWDAVERVYTALLDGRVDPRLGHVLSPPPS